MTYFLGAGLILLQILLALHVIRTHRNFSWVFLILFFPLVGSLLYLIAELIPEWERRDTLNRLLDDIGRFVSRLFSRY